jgi:tRNA (cmo5U34)-methyltransferase
MPNAHVTCVDLSREMLDLLLRNHADRQEQITVVEASYVDWAYPEGAFDLVVSNQTMHHFLPEKKVEIYRNILGALKPGGSYIEGDFMVDAALAEEYGARYERLTAGKAEAGEFHIDVPLTVETQKKLLREAWFGAVEVLADDIKAERSYAVLRATKVFKSGFNIKRKVGLDSHA